MCASFYVFQDDLFKIPAVNTLVVKKYIVAVHGQVLVNAQRPRQICAAITDEDCFFYTRHKELPLLGKLFFHNLHVGILDENNNERNTILKKDHGGFRNLRGLFC